MDTNETTKRKVLAIDTLREQTNDQVPEASDFAIVAKLLNMNRFASPTGKRWTTKDVRAAYEAHCAATKESA